GGLLAAPGLLLRQLDHAAAADVHVQPLILDVDPRPHDLAGPGDPVDRGSAGREELRALAPALRAGVAADQVAGRYRAGDLVDPHVPCLVLLAAADVVQGVGGVHVHRVLDAVGDGGVDGHVPVDLVAVRQGPALPRHPGAVAAGHRRALDVV